jgi:hypothetical protein
MFKVINSKVLSNGYTVKTFVIEGLQEAIELAKAWTLDHEGKTVTLREYVDDTEYRLHNVSEGRTFSALRKIEQSRGLMPKEGQAVVYFPAQEKPAQKKNNRASTVKKPVSDARRVWEVGIHVKGGTFTLNARHGDQLHTKTGLGLKGDSGQATYLNTVWSALTALKPDMTDLITLEVGDRNVAKMLKGQMKSRKNWDKLGQVMALVEKLRVQVI